MSSCDKNPSQHLTVHSDLAAQNVVRPQSALSELKTEQLKQKYLNCELASDDRRAFES
jgi:hypothetical protein